MSVSSWIDFKFYEHTNQLDIVSFLDACEHEDWKVFSSDNKAFYLPMEDDDGSGWVEEVITKSCLFDVLNKKMLKGDTVGIVITKYPENIGCNVLFLPDQTLSLSLMINRKITKEGMTDVTWYLDQMKKIFKFLDIEYESIDFSEHR